MKVLDLFSGIGGFSLAAHWMGWETAAFCEREPFCQKLLAKNFPNVPIFDDIKTLKGNEHGSIELVCGGFPCQPYSTAGERRGSTDDRALWPEMARVIAESQPRWVVGENVTGLISMGLDDVLADLESLGYACQSFVIPASGIGAPHRRDRVWIVAYASSQHAGLGESGSDGQRRQSIPGLEASDLRQGDRAQCAMGPGTGGQDAADADRQRQSQPGELWGQERRRPGRRRSEVPADAQGSRLQPREFRRGNEAQQPEPADHRQTDGDPDSAGRQEQHVAAIAGSEELAAWRPDPNGRQWQAERGVCGVDDGVSAGLHFPVSPTLPKSEKVPNYQARLKALGNSIVPQVAYQIFKAIEASETNI